MGTSSGYAKGALPEIGSLSKRKHSIARVYNRLTRANCPLAVLALSSVSGGGDTEMRAEMSCEVDDGFVIRWLSGTPIDQCIFYIDEINFFHKAEDEYVYIDIDRDKSLVQFEIHKKDDDEDVYILTFSGVVEFDLPKDEEKILRRNGYSVDYSIVAELSSGAAEDVELFEFIENRNITLMAPSSG